jgi:hypothetical protein
MAVQVFTNAMILMGTGWTGTAPGAPGTQTVSGTVSTATDEDISLWVTEVGVDVSAEIKDGPTHGSGGYILRYAGLKSGTLTLAIIGDYAASSIDVFIRSTFGGLGASVYYDVKPTNSARGATNPSQVGQVIISHYNPVPMKVGELVAVTYTWPTTGAFATLTS